MDYSGLKEEYLPIIMKRVSVDPESECWIWVGSKTRGYGTMKVHGEIALVHRIMCDGIDDSHLSLHKCDTPSCVNPDHLYPGTHADNAMDRKNRCRGSPRHGESSHFAKLSSSDVGRIVDMVSDGLRQVDIAKDFGISQAQVSRIARGLSWKR